MAKAISLILVRFGTAPQDIVGILFEDSPTAGSLSTHAYAGRRELLEFLGHLGKTPKEADEILGHLKSIPSGYRLQLSEVKPRSGGRGTSTEASLLASSSEKKTIELLKICRQMRNVWDEEPRSTGGGSFSYFIGGRLVYGINVGGELANSPIGELDIWVRTHKLAEVTGIAEETIKKRLSLASFDGGKVDFVIRLKTTIEAELLVSQLKALAASLT